MIVSKVDVSIAHLLRQTASFQALLEAARDVFAPDVRNEFCLADLKPLSRVREQQVSVEKASHTFVVKVDDASEPSHIGRTGLPDVGSSDKALESCIASDLEAIQDSPRRKVLIPKLSHDLQRAARDLRITEPEPVRTILKEF